MWLKSKTLKANQINLSQFNDMLAYSCLGQRFGSHGGLTSSLINSWSKILDNFFSGISSNLSHALYSSPPYKWQKAQRMIMDDEIIKD